MQAERQCEKPVHRKQRYGRVPNERKERNFPGEYVPAERVRRIQGHGAGSQCAGVRGNNGRVLRSDDPWQGGKLEGVHYHMGGCRSPGSPANLRAGNFGSRSGAGDGEGEFVCRCASEREEGRGRGRGKD